MLPSAFVFLDALPRTPSGTLDRRALLAPDRDRPALDVPYVAPRTPLEEQLAAIWSEVLGVERVGVYDNFFVLGGHSLLATQVVSRVREEFQVELPLRTLFAEPTLATLADAIIQQTVEQTESELLAQLMAELEGSAIDTP
jgi:acyl carrier protein